MFCVVFDLLLVVMDAAGQFRPYTWIWYDFVVGCVFVCCLCFLLPTGHKKTGLVIQMQGLDTEAGALCVGAAHHHYGLHVRHPAAEVSVPHLHV